MIQVCYFKMLWRNVQYKQIHIPSNLENILQLLGSILSCLGQTGPRKDTVWKWWGLIGQMSVYIYGIADFVRSSCLWFWRCLKIVVFVSLEPAEWHWIVGALVFCSVSSTELWAGARNCPFEKSSTETGQRGTELGNFWLNPQPNL